MHEGEKYDDMNFFFINSHFFFSVCRLFTFENGRLHYIFYCSLRRFLSVTVELPRIFCPCWFLMFLRSYCWWEKGRIRRRRTSWREIFWILLKCLISTWLHKRNKKLSPLALMHKNHSFCCGICVSFILLFLLLLFPPVSLYISLLWIFSRSFPFLSLSFCLHYSYCALVLLLLSWYSACMPACLSAVCLLEIAIKSLTWAFDNGCCEFVIIKTFGIMQTSFSGKIDFEWG